MVYIENSERYTEYYGTIPKMKKNIFLQIFIKTIIETYIVLEFLELYLYNFKLIFQQFHKCSISHTLREFESLTGILFAGK